MGTYWHPQRLKRGQERNEIGPMSSAFLLRSIPALTWLRTYNATWLRGDILAGITLAAYLLPAALGDASLANLPPEAGL
jgi:sulfate permease, SulP family